MFEYVIFCYESNLLVTTPYNITLILIFICFTTLKIECVILFSKLYFLVTTLIDLLELSLIPTLFSVIEYYELMCHVNNYLPL